VAVKRIKPNILSDRLQESRGGQRRGAAERDGAHIKAGVHPAVSIEVDEVDDVYEGALASGAEIVYPITDEDWGLRRFFVRDPNGTVITSLSIVDRGGPNWTKNWTPNAPSRNEAPPVESRPGNRASHA